MTLAYLHVVGCPCSRCSVSRNYARLLATVTDAPEADAPHDLAAQLGIPVALPERRDLDMMSA